MGKTRKHWARKQRGINVTRLIARDGPDCTICREPLDRGIRVVNHPRAISFDHVVPRSRGGLTQPGNLRLAHRVCNSLRGNDPLDEEDDEGARRADVSEIST